MDRFLNIEPLVAALYPCRGAFIALLLLLRSNSMMVALFTSWSLNTKLSFNLHWRNYNELNPKKDRKRLKPNTHWSYVLLGQNLNFFGIVSFNPH